MKDKGFNVKKFVLKFAVALTLLGVVAVTIPATSIASVAYADTGNSPTGKPKP